ncbi:hypothetical protein A2714_04895 [Candidatus Woesebacteria bacterium RIFCSPHIGHO2_01_FULL_38_9]|uniref:Nudix hydrolase domain-containing protein n=2 Tax=Candidatus Woeseibacteriota TaxID=1752722 RepID=A0A1F7Y1G9_9BACT|nr:MAG: hypothetical protein A2714_04895 [Candidatus Woesebacteria bacterium RIFCSPHIGHO2_01_FULL_38_9]OGM58810.1 MAG: hypothetical protein A3A75_00265 [Candidatus Woesebacteria bacterium RIFCSPLOWO2_01_FULL_39_10]
MKTLFLGIWKILRLPKNLQLFFVRRVSDQFLIGVAGIFFDEENRILLFRHTYRNGESWALPGGYIKAKEHPKEAIEREVMEESGLTITADERLKIRTDRTSARIEIIYIGSFIGGEFKPSSEVKEARLFSFDDLPIVPKDQLIFIEKAYELRLPKM